MASSFTCYALMIITFFFSMQFYTVLSVEFEVGGKDGWLIPPSKNHEMYNDWASKNRFRVNDTLHFTYKKDSVLEVTREDYDRCRSTHPLFYSNNANTSYTLDRSGLYFFVSGVSGHCERGLKMIIKVLEEKQSPPDQSANQTANTSSSSSSSIRGPATFSASVGMIFVLSLFGAISI